MKYEVSREIGGRTLTIETGVMAKQASGSVLVRYGDIVVFSAVTWGEPRQGLDFFPPDGGLPGEQLRSRQNSRGFLQT